MNIKNITVLGTGTMGHGIALLSAKVGLNVVMYGRSDESLNRGFNSIKSDLNLLKEEGKIKDEDCLNILSRIKGVKDLEESAKDADFVIESLAEDLNLKKDIFNRLDKVCKKNVILATNTSGISPTEISKSTMNPERVVVAHFWNPPQLIPLVEVVPGKDTSKETMDLTVEWAKYIGKKPVKMEKECPGFIGNRLQLALLREALYIVEKGWAKPEEVDKAMEYAHGRRLGVTGPICSADLGGLDIFNNIAKYLFEDLCDYKETSKLLQEKVDNNQLGCKAGKGFYTWGEKTLKEKQRERTEVLISFLDRDNKK